MTFIEFLEAFVRVAERLEIPNLEDDPETFIGMELTSEQKETFGRRPLHQKVDSLILYMAKAYMKRADYLVHCRTRKEYREEEDIWANDIDTGPLRLQ